jgi:DNA polymerase III gamma/tau subunit
VLGVPRLERVLELVAQLAGGDAAAGLGLLRDELVAGHDPSVVFQETGRLLQNLVHLAVDPELEPHLGAEHQQAMLKLARVHGSDALARMLGLWLDHESLLRDAANRELALEVACLRLARWPAVRRVEMLLAGGGTPALPAAGGDGHDSAAGGAPDRGLGAGASNPLSRALWEAEDRRLAGAVDRAEVELAGDEVVLRLTAAEAGLATIIDEQRSVLEQRAQQVYPAARGLRLEVESGDTSLMEQAKNDPELQLVQRVIGGEIFSVGRNGSGG